MAQVNGVRRQFVKAAMAAPFLERMEEHNLAVRWKEQRDEDALHQLASAHMRLVIALAARFRHYGLPMADLIQEGHVGLLEAAARFEPERASIQDYILRNWSIVRGGTSSAQKALFFNLRRLRAKLAQDRSAGGNTAMFATIAKAIGVSSADVELMDTRLSGPDVSLNGPVIESDNQGSAERVDFLVDDKPLPDETVGNTIDSTRRVRWLNDALTILSDRELRIVRERCLNEESSTLESLGNRLGISKERVRQIENRALEKLRRALEERYPVAALHASL
jgi:RNA polymerase sigma-32 factor